MLTARTTTCAFRYAIAILWCAIASNGFAQTSTATGLNPHQPYLDLLQKAQQEKASPDRLGYVWALLASSYQDTGDLDEALRAYNHALPLLAQLEKSRANYATALDNMGEVYLETGSTNEAEVVRKKAFRIRTELGNPVDLARSQEHLAEVLLAEHRYKQAEEGAAAAAQTLTSLQEPDSYKVFPSVHSAALSKHGNTLLSAYVTLTYAQCLQSAFAACLQSALRADAIAKQDFEPASLERAHANMALGFAQWKNGDAEAADRSIQAGLATMKARLGERHPITIDSMAEYRDFLKGTHRKLEAASLDQAIKAASAVRSASCSTCTVSVFAMR